MWCLQQGPGVDLNPANLPWGWRSWSRHQWCWGVNYSRGCVPSPQGWDCCFIPEKAEGSWVPCAWKGTDWPSFWKTCKSWGVTTLELEGAAMGHKECVRLCLVKNCAVPGCRTGGSALRASERSLNTQERFLLNKTSGFCEEELLPAVRIYRLRSCACTSGVPTSRDMSELIFS